MLVFEDQGKTLTHMCRVLRSLKRRRSRGKRQDSREKQN